FSQVIAFELSTDTSGFPGLRNRIQDQNFFLSRDSNNLDAYIKRAALYYQLGEYQKDIADMSQVLRLKPNTADAYCNIGMAYVFLKNTKMALKNLDLAIKLDPGYAMNYLNRAYAKTESKDYKGA